MISIDNIINFFTFQNIIIILLVIVVIYLFIKIHKNNIENFEDENVSVEAINNIGQLSKMIMNDNTLTIPPSKYLYIKGDNSITPRGYIALFGEYNYTGGAATTNNPPEGWAWCNGLYAWLEPSMIYGFRFMVTNTNSEYIDTQAINKGYMLTPYIDSINSYLGDIKYIIKL